MTETATASRDYVVCAEDELPPGSMKLVPVGKFGVGVYNVAGDLYAITNYCLHQGAPLCKGPVQGTTRWRPDLPSKFEHVLDGRVVRCPWHAWEFDIATGKSITDPKRGIRTYAVRVEEGNVILTR